MKWIFASVLVTMAMLFQQFRCNRCDYECAESGSFKIVDGKTGADLFFGPLAKYVADSVWITGETLGGNTWSRAWLMYYDSMFTTYPYYRNGKSYPSDTFYLLNQSDIDTIKLIYHPEATDCCKPYYKIKSMIYNGVSGTKKDGYWILTKY